MATYFMSYHSAFDRSRNSVNEPLIESHEELCKAEAYSTRAYGFVSKNFELEIVNNVEYKCTM